MLASALIAKARIVLQDSSSTRWTDAELLGWLNDGQREVVLLKPNASTLSASLAMVAGTKQSLPAVAIMLVDVIRNLSPSSYVIRFIDRAVLDAQYPSWHTSTQKTEIKYFTFDPNNPKEFFVYPPSTGSSHTVDVVYSKVPTELTAVSSTISLDDIYLNALLNYMLYRAYSKDAEYAPDNASAAAAYGIFANSLGVKAKTEG